MCTRILISMYLHRYVHSSLVIISSTIMYADIITSLHIIATDDDSIPSADMLLVQEHIQVQCSKALYLASFPGRRPGNEATLLYVMLGNKLVHNTITQ